jgi:hemoglobin
MKSIRMIVAAICMLGAMAAVASAQCGPMTEKTLFERLGGKDALTAVVDEFVARAAADTRINMKFAKTDIPRLKTMLVDQLCAATGGSCKYTGRSMKVAHKGMMVTEGEFGALVEDLVAALDKFSVPEKEKGELLAILGPLKSQIVEVKGNATGTALPKTYKNAPPIKAGKM